MLGEDVERKIGDGGKGTMGVQKLDIGDDLIREGKMKDGS